MATEHTFTNQDEQFYEELYKDCDSDLEKHQTAEQAYKVSQGYISDLEDKFKELSIISGIFIIFFGGLTLINSYIFILPISLITFFFMYKANKFVNDINKVRTINVILKNHSTYFYEKHQEGVFKKRKKDNERKTREFFDYVHQHTQSKENAQRGTFKDCVTISDIKTKYRRLAKKHHPDVGGNVETFRTLNIQYERAMKIAKKA